MKMSNVSTYNNFKVNDEECDSMFLSFIYMGWEFHEW